MITTDIDSLLLNVKKEQLITLNTKLPAGYGLIIDGQVRHVITTNFTPTPNKDLIKEAELYFPISWKYGYVDNTITNFAFCGVISNIVWTDDRNNMIQLGVEVINSYNQRSGAHIFYCFYNHTKNAWIKTSFDIKFYSPDDIIPKFQSLTDVQFGIVDIPKTIPQKIKPLIVSNMNGHHDAYDFITALGKVATDKWEHSSYELSRKTTTKIFNDLLEVSDDSV